MEVELISYSQPAKKDADKNPLSIAELAASVCYDSEPTETYRIAKGCKATGHTSVLEHISFTFHVTGVSRALLAQLSRHRHISLSVRSQRYCDESVMQYVNPFSGEDADVFDGMMADIANDYRILKEYHGAANEDARAVLPNACCTELYVTINARSLIEMSHLRLCTHVPSVRFVDCLWQSNSRFLRFAPNSAHGWFRPVKRIQSIRSVPRGAAAVAAIRSWQMFIKLLRSKERTYE